VSEVDELRESRARLAFSAGAERRRIERALHDGVQQDLITLSVRLQLLRELLSTDVAGALELLDELQRETHAAHERIQELAADVYPPVLDALGLGDALRRAATARTVEAVVDADRIERRSPEIERAVYFTCRAVLDAAKPDSELTIRLRERDGVLLLEITGASTSCLPSARDLLEAAGGTVEAEQEADGRVRLSATLSSRPRPNRGGQP
jgi:signal transduction histidine kinase